MQVEHSLQQSIFNFQNTKSNKGTNNLTKLKKILVPKKNWWIRKKSIPNLLNNILNIISYVLHKNHINICIEAAAASYLN